MSEDRRTRFPSAAGIMVGLFLLLVGSAPARSAEIFVAPGGKPDGTGTADTPYDLQTVLNGPAWLKPGATVWMFGGTYKGEFVHRETCRGTKEQPLVFRVARDARATILGGLPIYAAEFKAGTGPYSGDYIYAPNAVDPEPATRAWHYFDMAADWDTDTEPN